MQACGETRVFDWLAFLCAIAEGVQDIHARSVRSSSEICFAFTLEGASTHDSPHKIPNITVHHLCQRGGACRARVGQRGGAGTDRTRAIELWRARDGPFE